MSNGTTIGNFLRILALFMDIEDTQRVYCVIPARSGSKSIQDKNITPLAGHPLLAYSIAAAKMTKQVSRVIVSTDSEYYASIAKVYGAETPFLRPKEISGDQSTDKEFFNHLLAFLEAEEEQLPDLLVHMRPTTPLRNVKVVSSAIAYMLDEGCKATSLRSAYETHLTPYKMFKEREGYMEPFLSLAGVSESYNMPRQIFPKAFIPNGYVDVVRVDQIMKGQSLHGERIKLWQTEYTPDIDTQKELADAESSLISGNYSELIRALDRAKKN